MSERRFDSWYNSNILTGLNHAIYNVTRPLDWVDSKVNLLRRIPAFNELSNTGREHGGDGVATIAAIVAAYYGGAYLAGAGEAGAGAGAAAGGGEAVAGGAGGAYMGEVGLTGADVGTGAAWEGMGGGTEALAGTSGAGGAGAGGWQQWLRMMPSQSGGGGGGSTYVHQTPVEEAKTYDEYLREVQPDDGTVVASSAKFKADPGPVSIRAVAEAGASGEDRISQNGVHIGAIRALNTRIADLEARARAKGLKV